MTKHEFASAACKILGLYFMANAVVGGANALVRYISILTSIGARIGVANALVSYISMLPLQPLLSSLVALLIGLIIWRRADAIASLIAPEDS